MIVRDEQYYKTHIISSDDVLLYGMKKACILGNFDKANHLKPEERYKAFPYLEKEEFYKLFDELIAAGIIEEKE